MSGVPVDEVTAKDFIMVRAALVRRLGGANEALVWARVFYRCDEDSRVAHDTADGRWWAASYDLVGAEVGLTGKQARKALENLVDGGFLEREQHALRNNYDRVYSYRPVVIPGMTDVPSGADGRAQEGTPHLPSGADHHLPSGADVPSIETLRQNPDRSSSDAVGADYSDEVKQLCSELAEMVVANGHRVGAVGARWWSAADRLMRLDGFTVEQIRLVMRWATSDEFWAANVRSMPTLREKFSTLRMQRNRDIEKKRAVGRSTVDIGREVDALLRQDALEVTGGRS